MINMILFIVVVYFGYHFFKGLFSPDGTKTEVKGSNKNQPIDFRKEKVEDAKYKDIEEE